MLLDFFNNFGKALLFSVDGAVVIDKQDDRQFVGVGDLIDGTLFALVFRDGLFFIHIGKDSWCVSGDDICLEYINIENGISQFTIFSGANKIAEYSYPAWWRRIENLPPPGFGDNDPEDHDIGGYLAFMWAAKNRRDHLKKKYELKGSGLNDN